MAKIDVGILGVTSALASIEVLVTARKNGQNFVSSIDYPFLFKFFDDLKKDNFKYCTLVHHIEEVEEITGFNIRTDLEGHILSKVGIVRRGVKYYFNINAVDEIIRDLEQEENRKSLVNEFNRISHLLSL